MTTRLFVLGAAVWLLVTPSAARAQSPLPPGALAAEMSGDWDRALELYEVELQRDPARADLWVRVADIETARHNLSGAIDALERAAILRKTDAALFAKLSQAHAMAGDANAALAAIAVAVFQSHDSSAFLRARATLATWVGDYGQARDSYRRLARLEPDDSSLPLQYARVSAWDGATDEAVGLYRRYLRAHPEEGDIWLELVKAESWRGNYAEAADVLEVYRRRFGATADYARERAAVLAVAGRPRAAADLVDSLLDRTPDDYQLHLTNTIALAMAQRAGDALDSLDALRRIEPDSRDTRSAERLLRSQLSSAADPRYSAYSDSDRLRVQKIEPRASLRFRTGTWVMGGYERSRLDAQPGSGLEQVDGTRSADYAHGWAGGVQRIGRVAIGGQVGRATTGREELTTYVATTEAQLADGLRLAAERSSGFFVVSPRTVGLGIRSTGHRIQIDAMPALRYRLSVEASHEELSDGNRRWTLTVAPRRAIARTNRMNLDLGVSAYLLGTAADLDHGYYDPRRYEHYGLVAYPYFKIGEDVGLAVTAVMGLQRERAAAAFRFGGTVAGEATVGIYQPWVLKVSGSATLNRRLESGAYRGVGATVSLARRF